MVQNGLPLRDRSIPKMVGVACCVILFCTSAGILLELKINALIRARDWSEHSLEVRSTLQLMLVRLDRFDAIGHLYLLNRSPDTLRDAQNLGVVIESNAQQVGTLVSDNARQNENVQQLNQCASMLVRVARSLGEPNASTFTDTRLSCREVVSRMQEHERVLAEARAKRSEDSKVSLLIVGLSLACFLILAVLVLFGVLIRDAVFRRNAEEQVALSNQQLAATNAKLATTIELLEDRASEMKILKDARDQLQMTVAAKDVYEIVVHFVSKLLPESSGALYMIDNSRLTIEVRSSWGGNAGAFDAYPIDSCCGMRSGQVRWRNPENSVLHCDHFRNQPPLHYLCLPLMAQGDTLGVLSIECATAEVCRTVEGHLATLGSLAQLASMTIAAVSLRTKLENQSIRDSLTGLFNRHFMEVTLEREIRRASRHRTSLAVFMIDADNFKRFNDTFGHKAGDAVLRAVADRFMSSVRSEDVVCRYGGEEFVIILPDIGVDKGFERAHQIREDISSLRVIEYGQTLGPITVSIGVAMYPEHGRSVEGLLQAADASLYAAKHNGRNQVVVTPC